MVQLSGTVGAQQVVYLCSEWSWRWAAWKAVRLAIINSVSMAEESDEILPFPHFPYPTNFGEAVLQATSL
jgi:hypothetical protein